MRSYKTGVYKTHNINTETARWMQGRDYVRELVRVRDSHTCQMCFAIWLSKNGKKRFDVHHLNGLCGKKSLGVDKVKDIPNLTTLCHRCHYSHHQFSRKGQYSNR